MLPRHLAAAPRDHCRYYALYSRQVLIAEQENKLPNGGLNRASKYAAEKHEFLFVN